MVKFQQSSEKSQTAGLKFLEFLAFFFQLSCLSHAWAVKAGSYMHLTK